METSQKFGGNWTEDKLNIFTSYLDAYLVALQNQKFKKIYIDAFAGTGEIETSDGKQYLVGSAKRALAASKKFDRYFFIEGDEKKAAELRKMVNTEFPHLTRIVTVYCGDANEKLAQIICDVDWRYNRGLLFLDPYATQVNWTTLETVAKTKSIDVWYLFPFSCGAIVAIRCGRNSAARTRQRRADACDSCKRVQSVRTRAIRCG